MVAARDRCQRYVDMWSPEVEPQARVQGSWQATWSGADRQKFAQSYPGRASLLNREEIGAYCDFTLEVVTSSTCIGTFDGSLNVQKTIMKEREESTFAKDS